MYEDIAAQVARVKDAFPKSFIYKENELIVEKKNNVYFRIDDIESELEFNCKIVEWLSRPAHKGLPKKWQNYIREGMNRILSTNFNVDDLSTIYTYLGCCSNREETKAFVLSGYDIGTITTK